MQSHDLDICKYRIIPNKRAGRRGEVGRRIYYVRKNVNLFLTYTVGRGAVINPRNVQVDLIGFI